MINTTLVIFTLAFILLELCDSMVDIDGDNMKCIKTT